MSILQEQLEQRKKQEEQKKRAKENSGNFQGFDELSYCPITKEETVFRIVGKPFPYNDPTNRKPTDIKMIMQSEIVKEDKKGYVKFNFPYHYDDTKGDYVLDKDFILTKVINKVKEGRWEKYPEGKVNELTGKNGEYIHYYKDTEVYKIIVDKVGNAKIGEKFPKNFYPSKRVVINVIDRHDSWCKDNKHTKILTSKHEGFSIKDSKTNQDITIFYTDTGIPKTTYDKIVEYHAKGTGNFDVDTIVKKVEKDYTVADITDACPKFITQKSKDIGLDSDLTDEEKSYELYDFDKYFPYASSATKIKKWLSWLIKKVDAQTGSNFMVELEALAKIEEDERNAKKEAQAEKEQVEGEEVSDDVKEMEAPVKEEPKPEVKQEEPKRRRVEEPKKEETKEEISYVKYFPSYDKLSDEEKASLLNALSEIKDGIPLFNNKEGELLGCKDEKCKFPNSEIDTIFPESIFTCPVCGIR
ncbi:MAG TPA: hypothetical protein PLU55_00545 [Candidatus Pacearchaeota archaeon]|nr:hypothetical protein [Candidatus Pacearchaeota archaeon]